MTTPRSHTVPNLIQGTSQQAAQQRRETQCADQQNCLNLPVDGCVARLGGKVRAHHNDAARARPFKHEIKRSSEEHYVLLVEGGAVSGYNVATGAKVSVTGDVGTYLAHGSTPADQAFAAAGPEDTTFLLNRTVPVAMGDTTSPARPNYGFVVCKAGAYKTDYVVIVWFDGVTSTYTYSTPDNSVEANAAFITTNNIINSLATAIQSDTGVGDPLAGWDVEWLGSTMRLEAPEDASMDVDVRDGQGDRQLVGFTDRVDKFADLPPKCWDGVVLRVGGEDRTEDDDYWVKYEGGASTGVWVETVAPDTKTDLDASTLPVVLTNTALNTFTLAPATWGKRVSGDGIDSAKDPLFVGRRIYDLSFFDGRLALMPEASINYSKAGNAFSFFPDTAQTKLATDPIIYDVANDRVTLLRRSVIAGETHFLWGSEVQNSVGSGQDNLKQDTVEVKPSTFYSFDETVPPLRSGLATVMFATRALASSRLRELQISRGVATGETDITAHVPKLIPAGIRHIGLSDSHLMAIVRAEAPATAYVYQWLNQGEDRIQSAWNRWEFASGAELLWAGFSSEGMKAIFQGEFGVTIEDIPLSPIGDEAAFPVHLQLRLDHRVSEETAGVTFEEGVGWTVPAPLGAEAKCVAVARDGEGDVFRGKPLACGPADDGFVLIPVDDADLQFWVGYPITSYRDESEFYLRSEQGVTYPDALTVDAFKVAHANTVSYRVEVRSADGLELIQNFEPRTFGRPDQFGHPIVASSGSFKADVGRPSAEVSIRIINDSMYASAWQSAVYYYTAAFDVQPDSKR